MTNQTALDVSWDTINKLKNTQEVRHQDLKSVHQVTGAIADSLMTQAAIANSLDNLTIVMISFQNLEAFVTSRSVIEKHLF